MLIAEYLDIRLALFPNDSVKNKHHPMVHYPWFIQEMGAMYRLWSMRFEQKHQRYKQLMHILGNFKNAPKTIAVGHQHDVASHLLRNNGDGDEVEAGKVRSNCAQTVD